MILLTATTDTLELLTGAAVSVDVVCSFVDITTTAFTPGTAQQNVATATTVTIVTAPAASTQRQIKQLSFRNKSTTAAQTVTVKKDISGTEYYITPDVQLNPGEQLLYTDGAGWTVLDRNGRLRTQATDIDGVTGRASSFYKVGTAAKAAGNWYCYSKDNGYPGAWAVGSSGLSGRATDGTQSADAGCLIVSNPGSGANYLTKLDATGTVAAFAMLADILWVNNGVVVTTTTAQTVTSAAFPARDANGSTNGEGVMIGLLVTAATTNAGLISNMTVSYTNSDGTASRTATVGTGIDGFPISATIGLFLPFQLQAGDKGVRSIQSITLGTSLVTGSVSMVAYRVVAGQTLGLANVGAPASVGQNPGVRLYNGSCLHLLTIASATTLNVLTGTATVMER
jgi:hypothetical protein